LQNHCPEVGFLIHELVLPKIEGLIKLIAYGMKGTKDEPVLLFADENFKLDAGYLLSKFRPTGAESDVRIRATWSDNPSQRQLAIAQPRFHAKLLGGPWHDVILFLPTASPEFKPRTKKRDPTGRIM